MSGYHYEYDYSIACHQNCLNNKKPIVFKCQACNIEHLCSDKFTCQCSPIGELSYVCNKIQCLNCKKYFCQRCQNGLTLSSLYGHGFHCSDCFNFNAILKTPKYNPFQEED